MDMPSSEGVASPSSPDAPVRPTSTAARIAALAPFAGVHLVAVVAVAYYGFSASGLALALALYAIRMFFVTGFYHRYFSHRTFKTSRAMQFVMAFLAQTSAQKGAIWWASHHRRHHKHSDQPGDVHSVKLDGFWWSHVGWIVSPRYSATETSRVADLMKYPELVWLNRHHHVAPVALAVGCYVLGGMHALTWGFFVSTVLLWHGTFTINSLTHMIGKRRFATSDNSRNSWVLAIITLGEGWHNNHHHYQSSVNQGFYWWEYDVTYYLLRAMAAVGLVWDLRTPPASVLEAGRAADRGEARSVETRLTHAHSELRA